MPSKRPLMKLSPEEECFLRHWMYDEVHYQQAIGPAKRLQLQHGEIPADLAILIAAAIPDPLEQQRAGAGPPPSETPRWPWKKNGLQARLQEARKCLAAFDESLTKRNLR